MTDPIAGLSRSSGHSGSNSGELGLRVLIQNTAQKYENVHRGVKVSETLLSMQQG